MRKEALQRGEGAAAEERRLRFRVLSFVFVFVRRLPLLSYLCRSFFFLFLFHLELVLVQVDEEEPLGTDDASPEEGHRGGRGGGVGGEGGVERRKGQARSLFSSFPPFSTSAPSAEPAGVDDGGGPLEHLCELPGAQSGRGRRRS